MPDDAGTRIVGPQCGSPDGHISDKKSLTLSSGISGSRPTLLFHIEQSTCLSGVPCRFIYCIPSSLNPNSLY